MRPRFHRLREINRLRLKLEHDSFPRFQMLLIVAITGASGFVASYWLLQAGLTEMWVRYLCAFSAAYLVFLFLLWLWLRTTARDYSDVPDFSGQMPSRGSGGEVSPGHSGKGGDFGGGGASGTYDGPPDGTPVAFEDGGVVGDALGAAAQAEEFAIPLVVLILLGALFLSAFFVIYSAPVFLAELLVDGVLAASLYRRLRGLETRHWLDTAVRRTAWPFAATAVIVSVTGWAMNLYAPEAHSIGEVLAHGKHIW